LVRQLQEKLAEYGYYEGDIDGRFGNQTRRAVEAFQYQHGLSVDGIAGRRTLTVLYESPEIRPAPALGVTPEPTAAAQLSVALTPAPSPTFAPVETAAVVKTQSPVMSVLSTATPVPALQLMEGYSLVLGEASQPLEVQACRAGEQLYLPLMEILSAANVQVISSSTLEKEEMAFVIGSDLIGISYKENQAGDPIELEAYKNTEPQILPGRDIRRLNGAIYLNAANIKSLTGITAAVDENAKVITVTLP